ncbi:(2Fe-2S)-binding protein [Shewanella sp. 202IG2-18]|nr:(2Fe-2S)-binding protein [Parashewanella hymeniacidonis]MBM7072482.1 (2Fe-2S)-binding protein [Parashewanella hymeniacidonis]
MYVCICHGIKEKDIQQAIDAGAESVRDLRKKLDLGSQCGKCVCYAAKMIKNTKGDLNYDLAIAV